MESQDERMAVSNSFQTVGSKTHLGSDSTALCREALAESTCCRREWIMLNMALAEAAKGE